MNDYAPNLATILEREPLPASGIVTDDVDYEADGVAYRGYLARPGDEGRHPGVLVVHDWLGVTDYVRMRCDMLARLGYVAFAADVFGADVRPTPQEAPEVAGRFYQDRPLWRKRLGEAFDRLRAESSVDAGRTAAIGYCFGGSSVLELARTGATVDAVVSFHGGLLTGPAGEAQQITAKLLVLHGAADPVAPDDAMIAFRERPAHGARGGLAAGVVRECDARLHASGCRRPRAGRAVPGDSGTAQLGRDEGVPRGGVRIPRVSACADVSRINAICARKRALLVFMRAGSVYARSPATEAHGRSVAGERGRADVRRRGTRRGCVRRSLLPARHPSSALPQRR